FIALAISLITDLKTRKILNIVTYPAIILGLLLNTIFGGVGGLKFSAIGFVIGFVIFGTLNFLGAIGMGDVKLMAAIGALKGGMFALFSIIYIGLAGGILTILYLIIKGNLGIVLLQTLYLTFSPFSKKVKNRVKEMPKIYLPYGPAMILGVIWYYLSQYINIGVI
ncbi:prepilin peptidase, partial [bacterium]|nr:prepilin peptidase [bacterium]